MSMLPQEFYKNWQDVDLRERQTYQRHFLDVCQLVGIEMPTQGKTPDGKEFVFEKDTRKESGGLGYADVWYENRFAVEYKSPGKDLNAAYAQLKQYWEKLRYPPILIVTDIHDWYIYTHFRNADNQMFHYKHSDILDPKNDFLNRLKRAFTNPDSLNPNRSTEDVTKEVAENFIRVLDYANKGDGLSSKETEGVQIANFMTRLMFALFAEDINLLPSGLDNQHGIFTNIIAEARQDNSRFVRYVTDLFKAMETGGEVLMRDIPYFNGALFKDISVEPLSGQAIDQLYAACVMNWRNVEPSIFGTLFERSLDTNKRAQLGAHYTSPDDIMLIVEPVLMQPLKRQWETIQQHAAELRPKYDAAVSAHNRRDQLTHQEALKTLRDDMLTAVRGTTVLDPACGSGNFLYVALKTMLDFEKEILNHSAWIDLYPDDVPQVHPRQLHGLELNPIAHALASIVVWIGYIQWMENNGYGYHQEPILENLEQNIVCMDAILQLDAKGNASEPDWPAVDVIIGNPPFLGGYRQRSELGSK